MAIQSPSFQQEDWIATLPRIKCGVARNDGEGKITGNPTPSFYSPTHKPEFGVAIKAL